MFHTFLRYFLLPFFSLTVLLFTASASAIKTVQLALDWKPEPEFGGFYAAELSGHYAKAGMKVKILPGGSGTPTIQMIATKKVDYAIVSADEVLLSYDRGAKDVVALFAVYKTYPRGIMTHASAGYQKLEDLLADENATLQLQLGHSYVAFLRNKYPKMKVKTVPYSGGIGPFQNNPKMAQQCFITSEPIAATRAGLKVKTFAVADEGYNPYTAVVVTHRSRWLKNRAEIEKFIESTRAGWNEYLQDPKPANAHMQKLNPAMDLETFAQIAQAQRSLIEVAGTGPVGQMDPARWEALAHQLLEIKLIKNKPDLSAILGQEKGL